MSKRSKAMFNLMAMAMLMNDDPIFNETKRDLFLESLTDTPPYKWNDDQIRYVWERVQEEARQALIDSPHDQMEGESDQNFINRMHIRRQAVKMGLHLPTYSEEE